MKKKSRYVMVSIIPKGYKTAGDYYVTNHGDNAIHMSRDALSLSEIDEDDLIFALYERESGRLLTAFYAGKQIPRSRVPSLRLPLNRVYARLSKRQKKPKNDHDVSRHKR